MTGTGERTNKVFVLGASTIPGEFIVPRVRTMIDKYLPGVELSVLIADSRQIFDKVRGGELEVGIIGSFFHAPDVEYTVVAKNDRLVIIVPPEHSLASKREVSLADLRGQGFVAREQGSGTRSAYEKALADAGIPMADLRIVAEVNDSASVVGTVASGAGIGIVSELAARDAIEGGKVRSLNIPVLNITRNFYVITRKGRELSSEGDRVLTVIMAVLR